MSAEGTVEINHIWKRFRRDRGRRLMRDQFGRAVRRVAGRDGPNPWRWVLRDIDIKIDPGESVGFVGPNGAGKSTLLKIVSGVMFPHSGNVHVRGRIGALLEVSSGIHPDLTGRENISVFGTLLGFSKREIEQKFDEIVAFSELEDAVDRQAKFYSSGMKTRLGFAIAAHLEPEVLIVDEVLAVGDQIFQQKCLDRMRSVLDSGATLMLVSHDLASVGATASRGIWLNEGTVMADGPIDDVLALYRKDIETRSADNAEIRGVISVNELTIGSPAGTPIESQSPVTIAFTLHSPNARQAAVYVGVSQGPATPIFVCTRGTFLREGQNRIAMTVNALPLPAGSYYVWVAVRDTVARRDLTPWQPLGPLAVGGAGRLDPVPRAIVRLAPVHVDAEWHEH
jgi:ABC-type polysaccharide/polyol phosphate transport system ATPase subunit